MYIYDPLISLYMYAYVDMQPTSPSSHCAPRSTAKRQLPSAQSLPPHCLGSTGTASSAKRSRWQVSKVGDSRGSLRGSLACVTQLCWVPRKMLAGQGNVYACAVV